MDATLYERNNNATIHNNGNMEGENAESTNSASKDGTKCKKKKTSKNTTLTRKYPKRHRGKLINNSG